MAPYTKPPCYTWPSDYFPFREYFSSPSLRIFIIENIHHNWKWLSSFSPNFQSRDYFFVYCGWHFNQDFLKTDLEIFNTLRLNKHSFYFLFNSQVECDIYRAAGFHGEVINHNCWIDWEADMQIIPDANKLYDAIYVARFTPFKRHELANEVQNLALVMGDLHGSESSHALPQFHTYKNEGELSPAKVNSLMNQSYCGLILSESEGACFSSSEYLISGIPVVSTHSNGGRDVWYDATNSLVVDPNPKIIAEAVQFFVAHPPEPWTIRKNHIELAQKFRLKFIDKLDQLFSERSVREDAKKFIQKNFYNKMRLSEKPDFERIWPS